MRKDGCREFTPFTSLFKSWFALRPDLAKAKAILYLDGVFYWGRRLAANKSKTPSVVMTQTAYQFVQGYMRICRPVNFEGDMHHPIPMVFIVDQFKALYNIDTEDMFILNKDRFIEFHAEKIRKAPLVPMSKEGHRNFHRLQDQLLEVFNRTAEEDDYLNVYKFVCKDADIEEKYDFDFAECCVLWKQFLGLESPG